ncbi:MAG TPA: VWA domain-containing protein [Candidatus Limiplasma sp.]|nr:VWA domain-containing protein [Candidatus Limiplasma sp.]
MKKDWKELVFILDKSGSMGGLESDTIGGYNAMLQKQQQQAGACRITTVLFDSHVRLLHDRTDLCGVRPITSDDYCAGGSTALIDAIGMTLDKIANAQKHTDSAYRPESTLVVIITDGEENASREYTLDAVRRRIETLKAEHSWEFIFLGANIDAVTTAAQYGIAKDRAQNYHADSQGVATNYRAMSSAVTHFRTGDREMRGWNDAIKTDFTGRDKQ